ncbi:hypothetical protein AAB992_35760 [Burkholderia contaminans]|uniref:hypothetical protein n=1 Tax=Burkholderia contaminans TaxID=488447 RepID=UPI00241621F9|nr:hypothetical protein [Burkholderia contaminans]WFN13057.1 hypothetical protein LXE92_18935 [Burkholderia contaminans]
MWTMTGESLLDDLLDCSRLESRNVTLRVSDVKRGPHHSGTLVIEGCDTRICIPAGLQRRIFEPYQHVEERRASRERQRTLFRSVLSLTRHAGIRRLGRSNADGIRRQGTQRRRSTVPCASRYAQATDTADFGDVVARTMRQARSLLRAQLLSMVESAGRQMVAPAVHRNPYVPL